MDECTFRRKAPFATTSFKEGGGLIFEVGPILERLLINRHSTRKNNLGMGVYTEEVWLCKSPSHPNSTSEAMNSHPVKCHSLRVPCHNLTYRAEAGLRSKCKSASCTWACASCFTLDTLPCWTCQLRICSAGSLSSSQWLWSLFALEYVPYLSLLWSMFLT